MKSLVALVASLALVRAVPMLDLDERGASLVDCLQGAQVPTSRQWDSNFTQLSKPYNLRLPYRPAAIALPQTPEHVSKAVTCAAEAGIKVQPKSGGHSYSSFSLGGQDGSLVVDMEAFQEIQLDRNTNIATVGTGVRLGNLAQALYYQGGRAVPHGTCPG